LIVTSNNTTEIQKYNIVNSSDVENNCFQSFSDEYSQTFCGYFKKVAKDFLVKFGNTITLIDATYKTTKYEVASFFLCVKTNVGCVVVAKFVVSSELA